MKTDKRDHRSKVIDPKLLKKTVASIRKQGHSIGTLNGSFDLLHAGHLYMISEASKQGDVLIVALNSDASIRKYKHPDRPIIPLTYRLEMLAALEYVDFVTWFDETTPIEILSIIQPDVHTNGNEYGPNCVEAETVKKHGGKIHIVDLIPGLSTSMIINRAKGILCE